MSNLEAYFIPASPSFLPFPLFPSFPLPLLLFLSSPVCVAFGFAQYMSPWDEQSVLRGSPLYMAPEMVCRQQYDSRVDLWSVGVILYGKVSLPKVIPYFQSIT